MKATGTTAHKLKFEINVNGGNNHKPDHRLTKISANGIKLVFEKFQEGNTVSTSYHFFCFLQQKKKKTSHLQPGYKGFQIAML
jgi:hypothetical protein